MFGHVLSLAGNSRNKSTRSFGLVMGKSPLFRVFSTFQNLEYIISKNIQDIYNLSNF